MPNVHQVHIIKDEAGVMQNGLLLPYDFACGNPAQEKVISGVYITISGSTITEHPTNVAGSEYVTKVHNPCNNTNAYLRESPTTMALVAGYSCTDCRDINTPTMAGENCTTPMHMKDCDRASLMAKLQDIQTAITNMQINVGNITIDNTEVVNKLDDILNIVDDRYDVEEHFRLMGTTPPTPFTGDPSDGVTKLFAANLYHSITVLIENGVGSVTIGGKKLKHQKGYAVTFSAVKFLTNDIIVTTESNDSVITITTIK